MPDPARSPLTCIEVGAGGVETVVLAGGDPVVRSGAHATAGTPLLLAVPGLISVGRVVAASNLGWYDVDPAQAIGLDARADLVLNDAEAAALGESAMRDGADLSYVGLGTGVGGAVVRGGRVLSANLFGHRVGFGDRQCPCGRTGCLETVAAGWALPASLDTAAVTAVAAAVAKGIRAERLADTDLVVVAGGLARGYPGLVPAIAAAMPERTVEPSAAPKSVKSAAAWGLAHAFDQRHRVFA